MILHAESNGKESINLMVQYASIERKSCRLSEDFAVQFVTRRFGNEIAALIFAEMPTYSRGPRKGKTKGFVIWNKVAKGGWVRTGPSYHGSPSGHVAIPGTHDVQVVLELPEDWNNAYGIHEKGRRENQSTEDWATEVSYSIGRMKVREYRVRHPYRGLPDELKAFEIA